MEVLHSANSGDFLNIDIEMENVVVRFLLDESFKKPAEYPTKERLSKNTWYMLHIIVKGTAELVTDAGSITMQAKDFYIVPRDSSSCLYAPPETEYFSLGVLFIETEKEHNENLYTVFRSLFEKLAGTLIKNQNEFASICATLRKDLFEKEMGLLYRLRMHLSRLLFSIYDNLSVVTRENLFDSDFSPEKMDKYKNANMRSFFIDSYLCEHYRENLSLEDLSNKLFLSTKQVSRIIKMQYNMTFYQYLTHLRIEEAKRLLRESRQSVEEVAYSVGFSTHTGFYKAFKQTVKKTPSAYRAEQQ